MYKSGAFNILARTAPSVAELSALALSFDIF